MAALNLVLVFEFDSTKWNSEKKSEWVDSSRAGTEITAQIT